MSAPTGHIRGLLRVNQLDEFAEFCILKGWVRTAAKGPHEVLRMFRIDSFNDKREWLIVHKRDFTLAGSFNVQHVTVWGKSADMAKSFFRAKREVRG